MTLVYTFITRYQDPTFGKNNEIRDSSSQIRLHIRNGKEFV